MLITRVANGTYGKRGKFIVCLAASARTCAQTWVVAAVRPSAYIGPNATVGFMA